MGFSGFSPKDFQVFAIPDFSGRMGAIRAQIQPKLLALGADLSPQLAKLAGREIFAHVAKHMRRTVNPPDGPRPGGSGRQRSCRPCARRRAWAGTRTSTTRSRPPTCRPSRPTP